MTVFSMNMDGYMRLSMEDRMRFDEWLRSQGLTSSYVYAVEADTEHPEQVDVKRYLFKVNPSAVTTVNETVAVSTPPPTDLFIQVSS